MQNCETCITNLHVLGIEQLPTTESEIKQAYRDGAKVWHPDRFQGDPRLAKRAEEQFKRIHSAYQQLTDHTRLHANYGSTPPEEKSTRPQESPRQKPSASSSQLKRLMNYVDDISVTLRRILALLPSLTDEERKRVADHVKTAEPSYESVIHALTPKS